MNTDNESGNVNIQFEGVETKALCTCGQVLPAPLQFQCLSEGLVLIEPNELAFCDAQDIGSIATHLKHLGFTAKSSDNGLEIETREYDNAQI